MLVKAWLCSLFWNGTEWNNWIFIQKVSFCRKGIQTGLLKWTQPKKRCCCYYVNVSIVLWKKSIERSAKSENVHSVKFFGWFESNALKLCRLYPTSVGAANANTCTDFATTIQTSTTTTYLSFTSYLGILYFPLRKQVSNFIRDWIFQFISETSICQIFLNFRSFFFLNPIKLNNLGDNSPKSLKLEYEEQNNWFLELQINHSRVVFSLIT